MLYMLFCRDGNWSRYLSPFSEEDMVEEVERLANFHNSVFAVYDASNGKIIGTTEPRYVFQKDPKNTDDA